MSESRSIYELVRFSSSSDADFAKALNIYTRFTAPPARTNSNEITQWVDETPVEFRGTFSTFGFYRNGELVGFAEAAFLESQLLFVVDYVVLDEAVRHKNHIFLAFAGLLRDYVEANHPTYRYVVAEVNGAEGTIGKAGRSDTLVRLLRWAGLHVVLAPYVQPRLALDYAESEVAGCLMISSREPINELKRDTYLAIVAALYYDYYLPWMSRYSKTRHRYKRHLDTLIRHIRESVGGADTLIVNGHTAEMTVSLSRPDVRAANGGVPLAQVASSCAIFLAVSGLLVGLKAVSHEPWVAFGSEETFALLATLTFFSIFSKDARELLRMWFRQRRSFDLQSGSSKPSVRAAVDDTDGQDDQVQLPPAG